MSEPYLPGIEQIPYEGPGSENDLAFRYFHTNAANRHDGAVIGFDVFQFENIRHLIAHVGSQHLGMGLHFFG